jgi:precorrin-6A synthase
MRTILVIGIGAGDPDHLTLQAVKALGRVDVFFAIDKGIEKEDLVRLRRDVCERHLPDRPYRFVDILDPERDRRARDYREAVEVWRGHRADACERAIRDELDEDGCGAFLVWGDPALYDGTLDVVERIIARGELEVQYEVIPGISSVQALAARHRVSLNRVGGEIHITTGRRLREALSTAGDDVVVMLDANCSFKSLADQEIDIYWGAYVGTDDEILIKGDLREVMGDIERARAEARSRKGWIMDTYLLKRRR